MSENQDDNSNSGKPEVKRVVVTYGGKRKQTAEDKELPSEILPQTLSEVVASPVDTGAIKSESKMIQEQTSPATSQEIRWPEWEQPQVSEPPKVPAIPSIPEPAKVTAIPRALELPKTPAISSTPEPAPVAAISRAPEPPKAPAVPRAPEPAQVAAISRAPEPPKAPAVPRAPEPPKAPTISRIPEPSKSVEIPKMQEKPRMPKRERILPKAATAASAVLSSNQAMPPPPPPPPPPPAMPMSSQRGMAATAALLLSIFTAIAVMGLVGYAYYSQQQFSELEAQSRNDTTSVTVLLGEGKKTLDEMNVLKQKNITQQEALEVLKGQLETSQNQLLALRGQKDWVLSEARYLVFMANERLQLGEDVPTALLQLKTAEERIASLGDPGLIQVREALAKDIAKLNSVPFVDKQGIWAQLAALNIEFNALSFKTLAQNTPEEQAVSEKELPSWQKALWQSWLELKSLIRITHQDDSSIPRALSTQEQAQEMRLMQLYSEQAQWAVLQGESQIYVKSLQALQKMIVETFNADQKQKALLQHLRQLEEAPIQNPSMDISASLQALSSITQMQSRGHP